MKTVYKYEFRLPLQDGRIEIATAGIMQIVHTEFEATSGTVTLWAEVDVALGRMTRFYVIGTGHGLVPDSIHCGTFLQGPFVWHLYVEASDLVQKAVG